MRKYFIYFGIAVFVLLTTLLFLRGSEDDWIKDEKGVYVKHGAPAQTPTEVLEQQEAVDCATELYQETVDESMEFFSQCLGSCRDYAVDIVHVPRISEDNLVENQCEDFRNGELKHFIELDENGEIVRIV